MKNFRDNEDTRSIRSSYMPVWNTIVVSTSFVGFKVTAQHTYSHISGWFSHLYHPITSGFNPGEIPLSLG